MSAEHTGQSPCPCRGCTTAYKAGYDEAMKRHDEAYDAGHEAGWKHGYDEGRTLGYREGHNEAMALHQNLDVVDWMYGYNQHGKGENP